MKIKTQVVLSLKDFEKLQESAQGRELADKIANDHRKTWERILVACQKNGMAKLDGETNLEAVFRFIDNQKHSECESAVKATDAARLDHFDQPYAEGDAIQQSGIQGPWTFRGKEYPDVRSALDAAIKATAVKP